MKASHVAASPARSRTGVFLRFTATSLLGTALDFGVLWLLVSVAGLAVVPAKVLASEASIINSFIWNERWTFAGRARTHGLARRAASFHAAYLGGLVVSLIIVAVGVGIWGSHVYLLANAVALPGNFLWTYAASNWIVWRPAPRPDPAPGMTGGGDTPARPPRERILVSGSHGDDLTRS